MVVECPECTTTFQLPLERLSARGSKVRCSKCGHTFRVRLTADGDAEVFYKNEGVADPPTQDLSDLFEESLPENLDDVFPGMNAGSDDDEVRRTMIGLPMAERKQPKSKSAAPDYNPFPFAAAKSSLPALDEPSIDLFDGADPSFVEEVPDPFKGAFQPAASSDSQPQIASRERHGTPVGGPATPDPKASFDIESTAYKPSPVVTPKFATALPDVPLPASQHAQANDMFGSVEDMIDPSFGQDTPTFDPNLGKVVESAPAPQPASRPAPAPRVAPGPPPAAVSQPPSAGAPRPRALTDVDDIAPHRIGGGGFQKFVNFLFLLVIAVAGLLGFIAFKTDGLLDFKHIDHMLAVAFEGKTYEPRAEWIPEPVAEVAAASSEPMIAQNIFARVIRLGRKDAVLVVSAEVVNQTQDEITGAKARILLLDENHKVLRESTVATGRTIPVEEISRAKSIEQIRDLSPDTAKAIASGDVQPIQAIFFDVPQRVIDDLDVGVRVELISPE